MSASAPQKTLRHVLLISALDGWSITVIAGSCALTSLILSAWMGVGVGLILTMAGVIELCGRAQLMHGQPAGLTKLTAAQLLILFTVCAYAAANILTYNEAALLAQISSRLHEYQPGIGVADLQPILKPLYFAIYLAVIGFTVLFQGGLALYYTSRKAGVAEALRGRSATPPALPR
jgi:hypothetical protein